MEINKAVSIFDALSQETRLRAFRLLVEAGHSGMAAGALSDSLQIPHNTMSFHLSHLSNVVVVASRREGRSIIYSANFEMVQDLLKFIAKDCCSAEFATVSEDQQRSCSTIELLDCARS